MVRCWIEHQFDRSNNHCSFEVLNIKNQDNNFDCGLLLCLLIWQFFQTQEVLDLVAFPWKKEFSHHYRFAVARAIFQQDLAPIEQLVQAKKEVLASMWWLKMSLWSHTKMVLDLLILTFNNVNSCLYMHHVHVPHSWYWGIVTDLCVCSYIVSFIYFMLFMYCTSLLIINNHYTSYFMGFGVLGVGFWV